MIKYYPLLENFVEQVAALEITQEELRQQLTRQKQIAEQQLSKQVAATLLGGGST